MDSISIHFVCCRNVREDILFLSAYTTGTLKLLRVDLSYYKEQEKSESNPNKWLREGRK